MSDWRDEYHRAAIRTLIKRGHAHDDSASFYSGYTVYVNRKKIKEILEHLEACGYGECDLQDFSWSEFAGTFTDNHTMHGVAAKIKCPCKQYNGEMMFKTSTSLGEFLLSILNESED